MRQARGQI
jgi:hypothetical protein